ncbi:MAG: iron-containing alcohol dehydrogenase [Bacteroidetes bacterium]|nr:iron-containing alcohol dehydrogenase [Bacteroidota bacterium]
MKNFTYYNPVKLVFGKGTIAQLPTLIPQNARILMTYGQGSIKRNGVYEQVIRALRGYSIEEFSGIEPNPRYETLMKAVEVCRTTNIDFLLAVGGGSVLDGTKFIAAAVHYTTGDPWDFLSKGLKPRSALPLGCVLTLPATGSEMNIYAVISRDSTKEKYGFGSPLLYPQFSILDPETTFTLPPRQTANGIVDAFVHVMEQYMTYPIGALTQDHLAEAIILSLIEDGPKALSEPTNYTVRANIMWSATMALNGLIGCGVPQDWTTHAIGHELTAFYGLDHGQTLAIVMPAVWKHQKRAKEEKLALFARRVWQYDGSNAADVAIQRTEEFFRSLGVNTRLHEYGCDDRYFDEIVQRFELRNERLGEHQSIGANEVKEILELCK